MNQSSPMSKVEKFSKTSREQRAFLAGRVLYRRLLNHWGSNFGSTPHSVSTGKWKFLGIPYWNIIYKNPGGEWHPLVGDYGKQNIARRRRDSQLADSRLMKKTYGRGGPERKCFKDGTDGTMLNIFVSDFLWWFCFHFCLMFRFPSWNTFAFFRFVFFQPRNSHDFPKVTLAFSLVVAGQLLPSSRFLSKRSRCVRLNSMKGARLELFKRGSQLERSLPFLSEVSKSTLEKIRWFDR